MADMDELLLLRVFVDVTVSVRVVCKVVVVVPSGIVMYVAVVVPSGMVMYVVVALEMVDEGCLTPPQPYGSVQYGLEVVEVPVGSALEM